ncbi:hypothetical protein M8J77_014451 [Diaphorina citri]|nr:hypothetical protein M8J77_014451 [Diaphorina citri]
MLDSSNVDKLLTTLEKNESDTPTSQDDECVICCNAKASMQTYPCGHRVVCRKCFVKTIQSAVSQRLLPLRCVICRSKILRLKQNSSGSGLSDRMRTSKSWSAFSTSFASNVPSSASQYSMSSATSTKPNVPTSQSLYSVTSGTSLFSGVSSVSSATTSSFGTSCSGFSSRSTIVRSKSLQYPRQPTGSLRRSQMASMKNRLQEFREPIKEMEEKYEKTTKLTPIQEFQREFRAGRDLSNSTRIRCAQKIITQLETTPLSKQHEVTNRISRINAPLTDKQTCPSRRPEHRSQTLSCRREKENIQNCSNSRKYSISMSRKSSVDSKELDKIELASNVSGKSKSIEKVNEKTKEKDSKSDSKKNKKELSKAEIKQLKKQAKAEKKRLKEEAKRLAKENKQQCRK